MIDDDLIDKLVERAIEIRKNAFVPKSNHKIGACVLTTDNEIFEGCNVENAISGLGVCAERAAIDHAVVHGKYQFKAMVTVDNDITFPCGACLQYLVQFSQIAGKDVVVIVADIKGNIKKESLKKLLPHGYLTKHSLEKLKSYKNK